jgi:hypothetical protein
MGRNDAHSLKFVRYLKISYLTPQGKMFTGREKKNLQSKWLVDCPLGLEENV